MIKLLFSDETNKLDVNSTRSIASIIYLAVVGVCVFIVQPGFVQGLVESLGLTPEQAGYIASAEMWGLAATTILLNFFVGRFDWQKLTFWFLLIAVIGNLASIGQKDPLMLGLFRTLTGVGLGGMISLPFAMMGLTQNPDRNFGLIVTWVLIYGALGLFVMPLALSTIQLDGVIIFFAVFCAGGIFLIRYLPKRANDHVEQHLLTDHFSTTVKASTLLAILIFNSAIGIVWAYLFLVGTNASLSEQSVANVLTISQFLGVAGAFLAAILAARIGRFIPLTIAVIGCGAGISLLLGDVTYFLYSLAVYLFNFLWNIAQPYLLALMASFADGGKMIVRGVALQMVGFAVGPYIGANLLRESGTGMYDLVNLAGAVLFVLSWVFLLPALKVKKNTSSVSPSVEELKGLS